jgi:hypothetical protein
MRTRTTLNLPSQLLRQARKRAFLEDTTLTEVFAAALREWLARRGPRKTAARRRVKIITYGKGWVYPGVDIDNNAALLDVMEAHDAPRR